MDVVKRRNSQEAPRIGPNRPSSDVVAVLNLILSNIPK